MGDRANICLKQNNSKDGGQIYMYTHWGGHELAEVLQQALIRGASRWDDEQYLGRILFSELIKDNPEELTGIGLSTYLCDNEHPIIHVDSETQEVAIKDSKWSFSEFTTEDISEINRVYHGR